MSEKSEGTPIQVAGLVVTAAVITNIAFYFLSDLYFEDRSAMYGAVSDAHINNVRLHFGIFTGSISLSAIFAAFWPRILGHVLAAMLGVVAIVAGVGAISRNMHPVLPAALIVAGVMLAVLVWKSFERSRVAWAFLIGMTSSLAAVLLFGSTKVRSVFDIGLWTALIIPGKLVVCTVALAMVRDDYREA
ncbi:MAG: hypothetical protein H0T46_31385 [Deltaproteobacteria bacterium]|nr:hypothetical protein [Deltaproteobacteria bacterium]